MTCRPFRAARRDERGFALVEVLVGMGIFAVIAMGFAGTMAASLRAQMVSRERTTATELASQQVESARGTPYDDLGTVGGNPPGVLEPEEERQVDGDAFVVRTSVALVDDPVPGGFQTFANYKQLTVTVHDDETGKRLARARTVIAPPTKPSLIHAVVQTKVSEMDDITAIPGVGIRLSNGPSGTRTGTTDTAGEVVFAALTPTTETGTYRVDVTDLPAGWTVLAEDLAPENVETAALATQRITVDLRAYTTSTLDLSLSVGGGPYAGEATVTVSSDWGTEVFPATGGRLVVPAVAGRPVMSGVTYDVAVSAPGLSGDAQVKPPSSTPATTASITLEPVP